MSIDKPTPDDPVTASHAFWYWIVVLMGMFMGVVVVMALIQTHAN